MVVQRPASAPQFNRRYGTMAVAAGVPCLYGPSRPGQKATPSYVPTKAAMSLTEHALKRNAPYAQVASAGWLAPGLEAQIKPTAGVTGAGVVSAGSIDNTYLPKPLTNAWGKARERSENEVYKPPRKQATDLLLVAKGASLPLPLQGLSDMASVRPAYSRTIPIFHPIDPLRTEAGFVRGPNIIPGAQPPPQSPMLGISDCPTVPANHKMLKLMYDQSKNGQGRIPVARVVRTQPNVRPMSAAPAFLTRAAGLPGGLSLIKAS